MNYRPKIYDVIYVKGHEEPFTVEAINEQEIMDNNNKYIKQPIYSIKGKFTGKVTAIPPELVESKRTEQAIKGKIDSLLDTYNTLMKYGITKEAEEIIARLNNKYY